jgi:glucose/arabinose dehydrogenase
MRKIRLTSLVFASSLILGGCGDEAKLPLAAGTGPDPKLPPPTKTMIPTVNIAPAKGWAVGEMPTPAPGLSVALFADKLDHPRWLYVLPNGDVLVAETNAPDRPEDDTGIFGFVAQLVMKRAGARTPSANRITLLRSSSGGGAETRSAFLEGLASPFGMVLVGDQFYVADTDALLRFSYHEGDTKITAPGVKVTDLPGGPIDHHWTKNVIASADGKHLYVTVGSNSNVGEHGIAAEEGRAAIWEIDPATGDHRVFGSGLRNPNGLAWEAKTGALWTVVNERDELGSDLVPDYLTSVKEGGFYGWPYSYYGQHVDERMTPPRPDLVAKAIVPDYALGPHVAALGLTFADDAKLGAGFAQGVFIGEHGSWNRRPASGYKVVFVPFAEGRPSAAPADVLTSFLDADGNARGRPVGVVIDHGGALLVADDVGNCVWRVTASATAAAQTPR